MIAIFVVFSIVLTRKACCACSRLVAGLLVGLIGGRRVVTWRLVASSQYLEPFCQIRVSPGWEGLYCAMVADAFRARKDQLRVNPKYWRRLEAEARVIALSMGDPENLNASCFTWPPGTSGLPSGPNCKTRSEMLTAHPLGLRP